MADQCIVCLETLDIDSPPTQQVPSVTAGAAESLETAAGRVPALSIATPATTASANSSESAGPRENHDKVAVIPVCGHALHDLCLREWIAKANSCPICRQAFYEVEVYDKVGGNHLSSYQVQDKKQTAEFDFQAWIDENPEEAEEEIRPCPICNRADHEDVLLLCDGCDAPYHTHCIGLNHVPQGHWYCMECVDALGIEDNFEADELGEVSMRVSPAPSNVFPRTQGRRRRLRQHVAQSDAWSGAWGHISGRVHDLIGIDLDYPNDGEDDELEAYRHSQRRREIEAREYDRWQQRFRIASRAGARDVFRDNISNAFGPGRRLGGNTPPQTEAEPPRPPSREVREERGAWRALERAIEVEQPVLAASRKRKSRSTTTSPREPQPEPERKLKRPRTRRLPTQGEPSSSTVRPEPSVQVASAPSPPAARDVPVPSFLSSLLKEVEMSTPSDDENVRSLFGNATSVNGDQASSSPATSPSPSAYSSPRALSSTPPPPQRSTARPGSPTLTLSSHIEPIYPPANYSPSRNTGESSDSERRPKPTAPVSSVEVRQPRPRRVQPVVLPRSPDVSPARSPLPFEMKANISRIVRSALDPHWKSSQLTRQQYETINRDVSRKLYEGVPDNSAVDDQIKRGLERVATREVARAVAELEV